MMPAAIAITITALNGTRFALTFAQAFEIGPRPPSRENAKHIRDALVRHALPQKSWPTVQMMSRTLKAVRVSAWSKIASVDPAPNPLLAFDTKPTFWTANVIARRTS